MLEIALAASYGMASAFRPRLSTALLERMLLAFLWTIATIFATGFLGYPATYAFAIGLVTFLGLLLWLAGEQWLTNKYAVRRYINALYLAPFLFMLNVPLLVSVAILACTGLPPRKYSQPMLAVLIGLAVAQKLIVGF